MKDRYGLIAPYYNQLAKLVFGEKLKEAKTCFTSSLEGKKVLIIGGGDGLDYKEIQSNLNGEYWEISSSMLELAKENLQESSLTFYLGEFQVKKEILFDEVWLHFVLDTMPDEEINLLLEESRRAMIKGGKIYLVDFFQPKSFFQQIVHQSMITFFRVMASHKRKDIPAYEDIFKKNKWSLIEGKAFLKGWVKAQIWVSESL